MDFPTGSTVAPTRRGFCTLWQEQGPEYNHKYQE